MKLKKYCSFNIIFTVDARERHSLLEMNPKSSPIEM